MNSQAEEIFAEALEVDPPLREEYLAAACGEDEVLRKEVDDLLRDAERAEVFFGPLSQGTAGIPAQASSITHNKPGEMIGAYRLVQLLGRGGFGSVWLAEQMQPLRRRVALKLIKRGMDSEEVVARFRAEQQALAMMNHPNIAKVFDSGVAPDGRPFFAMELVEGEKITAFCDARNLPIPDRLKLFLQVCSALNHAHQKGIIHRDLKPSNILVTIEGGEPVAKVIDFGIARAIEGSLIGDHTLTQADQFVGTPSYMSPEQAEGERSAIDTRTDVYSLGIVLYELLVGSVPFDEKTLAAAGREEIRRIIREEEPVRPSTKLRNLPADERTGVAVARKVTPEVLPRLMMAELDWIAMKAIDKSKERRYETMDALAGDVQRFLSNEPVSARPPSKSYLLGKMAHKHRALLGTAALIAVILVAATATSLWLAFRATQAEALAEDRLREVIDEQAAKEKALQDAEAVSEFIVNLFGTPRPEQDGRNVTVAEVLLGAEKEIAEKFAEQPARALLLKRTLAETYEGLGLYPEALKLREAVYEEGKSLLQKSSPESIDDLSQLAKLQFQLGYYEQALAHFQLEVSLREGQSPGDPKKLELAKEQLADCLFRSGHHDKAERLRAQQKAREPPTSQRTPSQETATQTPRLSPEELEAKSQLEFEELQKELRELQATRPRWDADLLRRMERAANRFFRLRQNTSALETQEELVRRLEEKYGPDHMHSLAAAERLSFYHTRILSPRHETTMQLHRSIRERHRRLFGPEHVSYLYNEARAAYLLYLNVESDEAIQILERVLPLLHKVDGRNRSTDNVQARLGNCYVAAGRTSEGIDLLKDCVPRMLDDSYVSMSLATLLVWGKREEEYQDLRRIIMDWAWERRHSMRRAAHIWDRHMLTVCLEPLRDEEDVQKVREIIRLSKTQHEISSLRTHDSPYFQQLNYGIVAYRLGDFEGARQYLERSLELIPADGWISVDHYANAARIFLAMTLARLGDPSAARLYETARAQVSDPVSADEPATGLEGGNGSKLFPLLAKREADEIFKKIAPPDEGP